MTENEFLLNDRITKIKSMNEMYDLEHNAYISFSGGKDSTVLSYLIDEALPNNKIPRVYVNTGLDYKLIREFVFDKIKNDERFVAVTHGKNIMETLRVALLLWIYRKNWMFWLNCYQLKRNIVKFCGNPFIQNIEKLVID